MVNMEPRVYVIDDEDCVRDSLIALLKAVGHETQSFSTASEFLGVFSEADSAQPQCLLVDIELPDMNGLDLLSELHRQEKSIPAIVITGHGGEELETTAVQRNAVAYFQKPFDTSRLLNAVSRVLEPIV